MNMPLQPHAGRPPLGTPHDASARVLAFLDAAATAHGRATHYNSRAEQDAAEAAAHAGLRDYDRDLYALLLLAPGVSDRARMRGLRSLLAGPRAAASRSSGLLDLRGEGAVIAALLDALPPQRVLKLFAGFAAKQGPTGAGRVNNARARKLVLRTLLGAPQLELWSVKYRSKVRAALVHAWGRKTASFLREALSTPVAERSAAQRQALQRHVGKWAGPRARIARECAGFVLGAELDPTLPLLVAFAAAKQDLGAGRKLPLEVLEGIRSSYHPQVDRKQLLELAKGSLSHTQRRQVQRRAAAAGVEVEFDPRTHAAVELYIHAYAVGVDDAIAEALVAKAREAAGRFPARYARVGVLVDASASMFGHASQALRAMAVALALRDLLQATGEVHRTIYCGGEFRPADHERMSAPGIAGFAGLCRPRGETSLAEGLLELLDDPTGAPPEAVYLISDGYENAPAGRLAEVLRALGEIGIEPPIYHLNPVFAAESGGQRTLAEGLPSLPVRRPEALGLSFLRCLIETEPVRGIHALLQLASRALPSSALRGDHDPHQVTP